MRLTKLHIENFRGIEKFEIDFLDQFTVLIGENGTGKTSVLDAIGISMNNFLSELFEYFKIKKLKIHQIKETDIRVEIFDEYKEQFFPVKIIVNGVFNDEPLEFDAVFEDKSEVVGEITATTSWLSKDKQLSIFNHQNENTPLPLIAYYGTGRLWSNNEKVSYRQRGYRLDAYDNALNPNYSNRTFLNWYKTYEDEILKFKKDDSLLSAFKNAITTCVEEWSDIGFSFFDDDLKGLLTPQNGEPYWMLFGMLSDGYRNLIGMVADMAYRCITLNPQLKENAVTETEGVVLIDEVGLHLHPKWQRKVVDDLKRTFPKVQFIATTHSPFIIQSLKASELVNLDRISDVNPSDLTLEEVVMNLMGVPSKFSEENTQQEALSKDYLLKVNDLQKSNGSAEDILKELDKMEHDISDPAVRAFLQMKKLQHTK